MGLRSEQTVLCWTEFDPESLSVKDKSSSVPVINLGALVWMVL